MTEQDYLTPKPGCYVDGWAYSTRGGDLAALRVAHSFGYQMGPTGYEGLDACWDDELAELAAEAIEWLNDWSVGGYWSWIDSDLMFVEDDDCE